MNKGLNKDYLPGKKPKKPFYKRLWFITLIVVLIIVVFNNNKAKIGKYISNIPVLGDIYSELMFATGGEAFVWNDIAMSKVLPKPQSEVGHVYDNTAAKLSMYVKNYSYTEYEEYVAKCIDKGFDIDQYTLTALESSNAVSKYGQEEKVETASATQGEELVDGMRPSVKKAIDSFEEYFVEYVELIEKIEADPDNPWLLVDYAEFLATYASTMRDFENMEDEDLNDAEIAYYLAALGRVNQMLINVTYEVDY